MIYPALVQRSQEAELGAGNPLTRIRRQSGVMSFNRDCLERSDPNLTGMTNAGNDWLTLLDLKQEPLGYRPSALPIELRIKT